MNIYRLIFPVALVFLFPVFLHAQKIDSMMRVYAERFPQEKVYVHFDKSVYNPGETIWFKAYLFSGVEPSRISRNFYAELSDAEGNILQRIIAPLFESTAASAFTIPAGLKNNILHFRAYTSWMLNFDTAFLYEKDIHILHETRDSSAINESNEQLLQFFPEGGDLVAGVENNIAFKATDKYGVPVAVKGMLKDATGKNILEFNSVHDGMGKFMLTPDKGDVFSAEWKDDHGKEHKTDFPAVKEGGVVLRLMNTDKKVFFSIARSALNTEENNSLSIIANMNQELVYKAQVNLKETFMSGGSIPCEQLPSGILQVTIFNASNIPVAERVIFINNHEFEFPVDLSVLSRDLTRRGKNSIEIAVPDTLRSNLSIAVTDAEADGAKESEDNIISRLLLTGDIKGFVYNPYYYFSQSTDSGAQYLDLIMLTHGWRRFKWDQLVRGKLPVIKFPEQNYLALKVDVLGVDVSKIPREESLNIILHKKDSSIQFLQAQRISPGKFGIDGLVFYDTALAYYSFNIIQKLSTEAAIVFNNGLFKGYKKIRPPAPAYDAWASGDSVLLRRNRFFRQEYARNNSFQDKKVQTLETVTVKGRQKTDAQKLDEKYTSGMFSGGDAYTFDLEDDRLSSAYMDIFTYLQGKVAGLAISTNGNSASLQWRGSTPTLYLNEMQVDVSQLKSTSVSDIAMVKVFRPGTAIGFGGGGGTIAVYTKKGGGRQSDPSIRGLERIRLVGYSLTKEFFSPDYSFNADLKEAEDTRATLYWNPYILVDKNNKRTTIQFFNNDVSRKLRVILEGINEDGKLTRVEKIIQ